MIAKSIKAQSFGGCVRYVIKEDVELLKAQQQQRLSHNFRYDIPTKIRAVPLTEQRITLDNGKSICFKNRTNSQGEKFDVYAIWSTQESKINFYYEDPCKFDLNKEQEQQSQQSHTSHHDEPLSGIGLFDLTPDDGGDDPEETAFRNRMQQQKKKRGCRI